MSLAYSNFTDMSLTIFNFTDMSLTYFLKYVNVVEITLFRHMSKDMPKQFYFNKKVIEI